VSIILPKGTRVEFVGEKAKNVTRGWYIRGGSFCCRCCFKYTFEETYKLYLRDVGLGRSGPRCPNCGQRLRMRSKTKPNNEGGFWRRMEQ